MSISEVVRERVRKDFNHRCGYCLSAQKYLVVPLEIDHILPIAGNGSDDEQNLCLACRLPTFRDRTSVFSEFLKGFNSA
jgi:5-methylcytosine-specific restriction endonuclease McrA